MRRRSDRSEKQEVAMSRPLQVLIVEDSEDDTLLLLRELRQGGFEPEHLRVETAESFSAALGCQIWDVVFEDYVLPGFSGFVFLEFLKASKNNTPFIVVSGKIGKNIAVQTMKAGANDYVLKQSLSPLPSSSAPRY